jgi:hypothetical protein
MRNRLYGGVRGRKMKVGGNYFIFLLLDCCGGRSELQSKTSYLLGVETKHFAILLNLVSELCPSSFILLGLYFAMF